MNLFSFLGFFFTSAFLMLSIGSCRGGYIGGIQPVVHLQTGRQAPGCQPHQNNSSKRRECEGRAQESLSHHHRRRRRCSSLQKCVRGLSLGGVMRHLLLCSVPRESVNHRGGDDRKGSGRRRKWRGMRRTNRNRDGEPGDGCAGDKCWWQLSRPALV